MGIAVLLKSSLQGANMAKITIAQSDWDYLNAEKCSNPLMAELIPIELETMKAKGFEVVIFDDSKSHVS
jgi:hypothetical protein